MAQGERVPCRNRRRSDSEGTTAGEPRATE